MSKVDIDSISRIHFIGIGGIGMSALARFFSHEKKIVSGSDRELTPITKALDQEGIRIYGHQAVENITRDIELIVYTEAMSPDHPEMVAGRGLAVPMVNYFEALGMVANPYYLIAVAGTHGKTTTTAMITDVFEKCHKDPTAIIGSLRTSTHSNFRAGKSKYAIVEACEYKRDFLHLKPDVLVITNIDYEHTDYYKDLADVQLAFRSLIEQVNEDGVVITDVKNPNIASILKDCPVKVIDYMPSLDLQLKLKQPGMHNRLNAAAAAAVAKQEKLHLGQTKDALEDFAGTWRRFEYKGELNGAVIYDDYAHHPTEIKATIAGARELYPNRRINIVFEPHTYSRTASLFDQFARAFADADTVILLPIYAARNEDPHGVTSRELAVKALEFNPNVVFIKSYEEVVMSLHSHINADDVVLVLGAGPVTNLANLLVSK
jgi:UDP-N-acetylmuramate--alanine ligase